MELEYFIFIFFLSLIVPIIYILLISGFIASITGRLTSANFELGFWKTLNLIMAYAVGSLLFSYIFHQFFKYELINQEKFTGIDIIMPFIALSFCYFTRVITRRNGHTSGRLYLSIVTAIASLIFILNSLGPLISLTEIHISFENELKMTIIELNDNLLTRINTTVLFLKDWILPLVVGSFLMAIVGEFVVYYLINPNVRSVPAILEKFPSDFSVITGNNNIKKKMENMTSQEKVHSIKCITNTYKAFEIIHSNLEDQFRKPSDIEKTDYRIIGSSVEEIDKHINDTSFLNFGKIAGKICKNVLPNQYDNYVTGKNKEIVERISKLNRMQDAGKIEYVEASFGKFRMLIVNDIEIIFTVMTGNNEKIGVYTQEKYIIQLCINLFEESWKRATK